MERVKRKKKTTGTKSWVNKQQCTALTIQAYRGSPKQPAPLPAFIPHSILLPHLLPEHCAILNGRKRVWAMSDETEALYSVPQYKSTSCFFSFLFITSVRVLFVQQRVSHTVQHLHGQTRVLYTHEKGYSCSSAPLREVYKYTVRTHAMPASWWPK